MTTINPTLARQVDKISYELMLSTQPGVIEAISRDLNNGSTARQIEKALVKKFGRNCLTAQVAIGAAYYLEAQNE